jgi:DNA-binding transcriptional LysR family regulator
MSADPVILRDRELPQRHIDLALMPTTGLALDQDTAVDFLFDDRHVVLAGGKNKWIRRRNIALADLIDEPWIFPPPDTPVGSYIAAGFRAAGLEPPCAHVLTFSIPLHQHLLSTGRFLTTLPLSMVVHNQHLPLRLLSVKFPAVSRPIAIVTLKNRILKPLARLFIDCAHSLAEPLVRNNGA